MIIATVFTLMVLSWHVCAWALRTRKQALTENKLLKAERAGFVEQANKAKAEEAEIRIILTKVCEARSQTENQKKLAARVGEMTNIEIRDLLESTEITWSPLHERLRSTALARLLN